jgi:GT2 family glycosyltransferase
MVVPRLLRMVSAMRRGWRRLTVRALGRTTLLPAHISLWRRRHASPSRRRIGRDSRVETLVSVLIPTLDAGPEFASLLGVLAGQRGLGGLEIVIADSGSHDSTVDDARRAGARVLQLEFGSFRHGTTRNKLADAATGEVLVFLVQDAIPYNDYTLRNLVLELQDDAGLAAVSARHVPRADVDLYGDFALWLHTIVMEEMRAAGGESRGGRRARAEVENVCAAIRRQAWEELRFRDLRFGEDLDFGLRAVERGWRVARSADATVIHSHRRDAPYHLRRSVIGTVELARLLGPEPPFSGARSGVDSIASGTEPFLSLVEAARVKATPASELFPLLRFSRAAAQALLVSVEPQTPTGDLARLRDLVVPAAIIEANASVVDALRIELVGLLRWDLVEAYARRRRSVTPSDAHSWIAGLAATLLGRALGDALRLDPEPPAWSRSLIADV